jgi:hypothetical protein
LTQAFFVNGLRDMQIMEEFWHRTHAKWMLLSRGK